MTNLLKFNHLVLLTTWWLFLSHSTITHAADLTFTPTTPLVKINKILTLSLPDIVGSVKAVITPPPTFSLENAQWEIFTNRQWITALAVPEDSNILWVATDGGLEKRDAQTGKLSHIFTKKDGLPESSIETLLTDTVGGLWVATSTSGLAYRSVAGQWTVFNTENSGLLSDGVETLSSDGQGGLWVGTMAGLSHWQVDHHFWGRRFWLARYLGDLLFIR